MIREGLGEERNHLLAQCTVELGNALLGRTERRLGLEARLRAGVTLLVIRYIIML